MRTITIILLLFSINRASGQYLKGIVVDSLTKRSISSATISSSSSSTLSQSDGSFILRTSLARDTIRVSFIGYKTVLFIASSAHFGNNVVINLQPASILLNPVTVTVHRNYKIDSLTIRKDFDRVFNYKPPGLRDIFIKKPISAYSPDFSFRAPNSTSQIISVNLLTILAIAGKNRTPVSKLQKALIRDEESNFVNRNFSADKITSITKLRRDSLQRFMEAFRPSALELRKMSEYDIIIYIKQSYNEFLLNKQLNDASPFKD